ncbi:MAG: phospholipid methyltransferase [Hyphomicrobiales bacterium]
MPELNVYDQTRFLISWLKSPLRTGAVAPSGSELAAKMASFLIPRPDSRIVELGPGTGIVTRALFKRGFSHQDINLIEYNPDFCEFLDRRYPGLAVLRGDAYALRETLSKPGGFLRNGRKNTHFLDGVVSSLPLLTRPQPIRQMLLAEAFELLKPGAPFIQFSYGPSSPVKRVGQAVSVYKSGWIWNNMPPARVWVYRKGHCVPHGGHVNVTSS